MGKKLIALLLIFTLAGGMAFADDMSAAVFIFSGIGGAAVGGIMLALDEGDEYGDMTALGYAGILLLVAGGLDLGIGFMLLALDVPFIAEAKKDPVLRGIEVDATPTSLTLGYSFQY
jgi:hypothetical protein